MVIEYDIDGRRGIGPAQPQCGINFPFVEPSADIAYLLADAQVVYEDPADYDATLTPFVPPFRLAWLSGCGDNPVSLPEDVSEPVHSADLCIVDSNDQVLFDTTEIPEAAGAFLSRDWGTRLKVIEWRDEWKTCRIVLHTKWSPDQTPTPREYDSVIVPVNGVLDPRVVRKMPKRVRSLTVVLSHLKKTPVEFVAGYNMDIRHTKTLATAGGRHREQVTMAATAGAGLGVYPGCTSSPLVIRRINGIGPNDAGDFYLAATDCYFVRQPTRLLSTAPRATYPTVLEPPYNATDDELPDALAGTTKDARGWPPNDDPNYAHLQIGSDCPPCCACSDYVAVAEYMNLVRNQYHRIGVELEQIRDMYEENRARWLASLACFHRRPLRIFLQPQICPFLDVAIQFCNQSDECITNLDLNVTFNTIPDGGTGSVVPGFTFISGAHTKPGRRSPVTERYTLGGGWPTFTAHWDSVEPSASVNAKFRLEFPDCGMVADGDGGKTAYSVHGRLTGTVEGMPVLVAPPYSEWPGPEDPPPEQMTEAYAEETRTLDCPCPEGATFNATKCTECGE